MTKIEPLILTSTPKPKPLRIGEQREHKSIRYSLMAFADGYCMVRASSSYPEIMTARFWESLPKLERK